MNRASWYLRRHEVREAYPSRADRGLPKHPDGSGLATCPHCSGSGVIDSDHWQPELCMSATCGLCDGSGYIADGYRDPLLRLRYARSRRRRDPGAYAWLRQIAMTPRYQLRLIEAAVGCELAARQAVRAWRCVA
jgi:hypothetical protein